MTTDVDPVDDEEDVPLDVDGPPDELPPEHADSSATTPAAKTAATAGPQ